MKKEMKEMVPLTVVPRDVVPVCPAEVSINLAESGTLFISNFYLLKFIYHVYLFRLFSLFPPAALSLRRQPPCRFLLVENLLHRIRSTQIWVVTRHQYGISAVVSQTSFRGEISGGVAKCRLFSEAEYQGWDAVNK